MSEIPILAPGAEFVWEALVEIAPTQLLGEGSGIPSFYTVCHLSFVCHDLLDPTVLFQQHGLTA
jgi:hypothetical protein